MIPALAKKGGFSMVLAGPLGKETEMSPEAQLNEHHIGLHHAAVGVLNAIDRKSPEDLSNALRHFHRTHQAAEEHEKKMADEAANAPVNPE